jgi:2-desacetyl-2-hydroxyethyl bacteriochlorophyllide A dehydrogenase
MTKLLRFSAPGHVEIVDGEAVSLGPRQVRVQTLFSGISAGTELTMYRGSNPYLSKRWDEARRFFVPEEHSLQYPVDGWGYEEVGRVVDLGPEVTHVARGDVIWGAWGHRTSTALDEEYAARRKLPAEADPIIGIFSEIGAIALNVVLDADIHVGETVAVFGLGVPGQIVAQLARLNGARVIGVDRIPGRLAMAAQLGADEVVDGGLMDAAEHIRELTDGRGADVTLEISGAYRALHEAVRSTAYSGRVVVAGFFQGDGAGLALGEEFHHNRIQMVCSQISGVAPALTYRWDKDRLLQTVMSLAASGRLSLAPLVSAIIPLAEAADAFALLDASPEDTLQVVLQFPQ